MADPAFKSAMEKCLKWVEDAEKVRSRYDENTARAFTTVKHQFKAVDQSLASRELALRHLHEIKASGKESSSPDLIEYFGQEIVFHDLRINLFSSYLAATWGIYDNLGRSLKSIIGHENSSEPRASLFSVLTYSGAGQNGAQIGPLQKKYKVAVGAFYQIRNSFLHRSPYIFDSKKCFISPLVRDKFKVNQKMLDELTANYLSNREIRSAEIDSQDFWNNTDDCLLSVCCKLQDSVDESISLVLPVMFHCIVPH